MPGLDKVVLDEIDPSCLLARVCLDIKSDFILAPHYNAIFLYASEDLWDITYSKLKSGQYNPSLPLTINVPKERGFTRPGSILEPIDRLVYQALTDFMLSTLEEQLNRNLTFSNIPLDSKSKTDLFQPSGISWKYFRNKIFEICEPGKYIVKADVANYFERLPQHHLINLMYASGCPSEAIKLLEEILLAFQQRDSFGIIQGVFPSDIYGNFYLSDLDAFCELNDIPSARYMDDIFLQFDSFSDARKGLTSLIDRLRQNGLHLNESKSGIRKSENLIQDETAVDNLFEAAREEIERELDDEKCVAISSNYGFQVDWEVNENFVQPKDEDIHLAAVTRLYNSIQEYPEYVERIEKFCLPILSAASSEIAIKQSLEGSILRPHLAKLYYSYLARFVDQVPEVSYELQQLLNSNLLDFDYQKMYLLAALTSSNQLDGKTINTALKILKDARFSKEVRAIAAVVAAKYGTPQQRRSVKTSYENEQSAYVRAAILYSSRYFPGPERKTCIRAWGAHSDINALVAKALKKQQ